MSRRRGMRELGSILCALRNNNKLLSSPHRIACATHTLMRPTGHLPSFRFRFVVLISHV